VSNAPRRLQTAATLESVRGADSPDWDALFKVLRRDPADRAAWATLYEALWPRLNLKILERYPLTPDEAADVVQQAVVEYRESLPDKVRQLDFNPSLSHFYGLVRYRALDKLREKNRFNRFNELVEAADSGEAASQIEAKVLVDEVLDRMDQRCGFALREFYFQGRAGPEIAAELKITPQHFFVLLDRCRDRCRTILSDLRQSHGEGASRDETEAPR
jgi:DNA-directed RNA polymerase specialized sigma24 family protein